MSKQKERQHIAKREVRTLPRQRFEVRKNADGTTISGRAIAYNSLSQDLGGFKERAAPGCLTSLRDGNKFLLYQHNYATPLARTDNGSLTLTDKSDGLYFSATLPDTSYARDLASLLDSGTVHDMSFGFSVPEGGDTWKEESGQIVRTLLSIRLFEISCVTEGAYSAPSASLRYCPAELRSKLKAASKRNDDDLDVCNPDSPDYDEDACDERCQRCSCDCDGCESGDCSECSNDECDDDYF